MPYEIFNKIIQTISSNEIRFNLILVIYINLSINENEVINILEILSKTFQFDLLLMMASKKD